MSPIPRGKDPDAGRSLRTLIVEDSALDADLLVHELQRAGYTLTHTRVDTASALRDALAQRQWDIILSDHSMPQFSAREALEIVKAHGLDVPFILVSGAIGEEEAVAAIRAGAHDYLLKDRLARLGPAVEGALREARERQALQWAEDAQRELEEQLVQMQRLETIGELASGIVHDINNLLTVIIGKSRLAREEAAFHPAIRSHLEAIVRAGEQAAAIARRLLAFREGQRPERSPLQLGDPIGKALQLLQATLPARVELQTNLSGSRRVVLADHTLIQQVVVNLCTNAWQAMGDNTRGVIEISLQDADVTSETAAECPGLQEGPWVCLTVRDNGSGMTPDVLEHLFDPFFTTKPRGQSLGLGLTLVQRIVRTHNGVITVTSAPGKGATFALFFPEYQEEAAAPETAPAKGAGEQILLVDDHTVVRETMAEMLRRLGYRVRALDNPLDAAGEFRAAPAAFDLVITDLSMRRMNGAELARQLVAIRPEIPIILTTGYELSGSKSSLRSLGIRGMLSKPVTADRLATAVACAMGRKPAADSSGQARLP